MLYLGVWKPFCCCSCYYLPRISPLDKTGNWRPRSLCISVLTLKIHIWIHCNAWWNLMQEVQSWQNFQIILICKHFIWMNTVATYPRAIICFYSATLKQQAQCNIKVDIYPCCNAVCLPNMWMPNYYWTAILNSSTFNYLQLTLNL